MGCFTHRRQRGLILRSWLAATFFMVSATVCYGQLPASRLEGIFPAGGAPGTTFEAVIQGNDLDDVSQLLFSAPGISAQPKIAEPTEFDPEPQPIPNTFVITVGSDVAPGNYEVRCQGYFGLSNARRFVVDQVTHLTETEPNSQLERAQECALPIVIHGRSEGNADVDWYRFQGTGGERIAIRAEARSIDSRMEPRISLVDSQGNTVVSAVAGASGDARLDVRLPGNGEYFVKIHDVTYQQGSGYFYRLCLGPWPQIESAFPPAVEVGKTSRITLYGFGLPGGSDSEFELDGNRLQKLDIDVAMPNDVADRPLGLALIEPQEALIDAMEVQVGSRPFLSEGFRIASAGAPVTLEQEGNNRPEAAQALTLPCEVAGRFYPQGDVDWYSFEAEQGDVWFIDVISNRLGWPTDPAILLHQVVVDAEGNESTKDIIYLDDVPQPNNNQTRSGKHEFDIRSTDPSYRFEVPATARYRLFVRDSAASARTDPRWTYQLRLRQSQPDFRLVSVPGDSVAGLVLRPGGRDVIRVSVARIDGFNGEIRVSVEGLPAGLSAEAITIGPESEMGTLVLTAASDLQPSSGTLRVTATAVIDGSEVKHASRYGQALVPWNFQQPNSTLPSVFARLAPELRWCVIGSETSFATIQVGQGANPVYETCRGGILKIPYTVTRQANLQGQLQGFLIDIPLGTQAQQVTLNDTGEFELRFNQQVPPGEHTIYLAGFYQNMRYERYPASTERIKERQARIAQLLTDGQQKDRDLTTAVQQAQQLLNQKTQEATAAETALNQAKQQAAAAQQQLKQAEEAAQRAAQAAADAPEDANAKAAADAAAATLATMRTAADEAVKKEADAQTARDAALKGREEATLAKAQADQLLAEAKAFVQRAQQEKQRADQAVQQAQQRSNPRNINASMPSNNFTLRIAPYPIVAKDLPIETALTPGEPLELPVGFERKYEFTGPVNLQVQQPSGVNGIQVAAPNIAGELSEGKITLTAQPNATPGKHTFTLRMQMNMNGANLLLDRTWVVIVPEPPAETGQ